jgi:hypothetical protein
MSRLTEEQVRKIVAHSIHRETYRPEANEPDVLDRWAEAENDRVALLADREALVAERDNWIETARLHHKNAEYYRGLVIRIGEAIGSQSYVSDDGSVQQDVLCAKVPDLVEALVAEIEKLRRVVEADRALFHAAEFGTAVERQQALGERARALADLEAFNAPDATDDKN